MCSKRYFPSVAEKKTTPTLFSVRADGKMSKLEAIFRLTIYKVDYMTLFFFHHGRIKIVTDGK